MPSSDASKILIDLSILKNIYCGLGQVALQMGTFLSKSSEARLFDFWLPEDYVNSFGSEVSYTIAKKWKKNLKEKHAVVHLTYQASRIPVPKHALGLCTIHDLNFLFEKKRHKHPRYMARVKANIKKADTIVFISNFVKEIVNENIQIPSSKSQYVIYNGVSIETSKDVNKPSYVPNGNFLFSIGELKKKKNFHVLLDFLVAMPKPIPLLIAGNDKTKYGKYLKKEIKRKNLEHLVFILGTISEDDKIYLYKNCKAFVFPALYEGFGIPLIEAMRFGKAVFTSTSTSLPEIGADKAFYWENFSPNYMAEVFTEKMAWFDAHPDFSKELVKHSELFTYKKNIEQYVNLYKKLYQKETLRLE